MCKTVLALGYALNTTRNNSEQVCILEGEDAIYECAVTDIYGSGATVWNGTAFTCPNPNNYAQDNKVLLLHRYFESGVSRSCNDGGILGQSTGKNGTRYISTLTVKRTSRNMNGKTIVCSLSGVVVVSAGVIKVRGKGCAKFVNSVTLLLICCTVIVISVP